MNRLLMLALLLLLTGCGISEEQKQADQVSDLNEQANSHYMNGNLSDAIEVYEKSLSMQENVETRDKMSKVREEAKAVESTRGHLSELRSLTLELQQNTTFEKVIDTGNDIEKIISEIPLTPAPADTEINQYLSDIPTDADYLLIQIRLPMFMLQAKGAISFDDKSLVDLVESLESFLDNNPLPEFYK